MYRAEILLTRYRRLQVVHRKPLPSLQAEMLESPYWVHSPNEIDACGQALEFVARAGRNEGLRVEVR